jgi:hypothetical protein
VGEVVRDAGGVKDFVGKKGEKDFHVSFDQNSFLFKGLGRFLNFVGIKIGGLGDDFSLARSPAMKLHVKQAHLV